MAIINESFIKFLEKGLQAAAKQKTLETLGDRSTYVGSSDVGQCPRKAYLSKVSPKEYSLEQNIIFARGHNAELIVRDAFLGNKTPFKEQVEVQGKDEFVFVKTHIDFLAEFKEESVVVECKSTNSLPSEPYASWVKQVILQIGLLKEQGVNCNRGIIVALNVNNGEHTAFNVEFSQSLYELSLKRAKDIWKHLQNGTEPQGEVSPICSFCSYRSNCEALLKDSHDLPDELVQDAKEFAHVQSVQKELTKKSDALKLKLIEFMSAAELKKVSVDDIVLSKTEYQGRIGVDTKRLQSEYPEIFENLKTQGKPYSVLKVS